MIQETRSAKNRVQLVPKAFTIVLPTGPACWRMNRWLSSAGLIILETKRLRLRHLSPVTDAGFVLELLNEPSFIRYIGDKGTRNLDDARRYIVEGPLKSYQEHGFGLYLVELKSGTPIGICGIIKRNTLPDADIGFAFLPAYWNQGYAFESAAAIMTYARNTLRMDRILAITTHDNEPSAKLLEKIGLRFDRMIRLSADAPEIRLFTTGAHK
jgi:ribosomal-protein-alanine N-acetyltransferase